MGPPRRGDILDRARLDEVFATYSPEAVIHFAAYAYVGELSPTPENITETTLSVV